MSTNKTEIEESTSLNLQFEKRGGLLPCIAQDDHSGKILMIGSINVEAWEKTIETGYATFWSTSRDELWTKGLSSGDLLKVENILIDCDQDAVIYKVTKEGAGACHTKSQKGTARESCFYRSYNLKTKTITITEP